MTNGMVLVLFMALAFGLLPNASAAEKPRVFVLTDIENEPENPRVGGSIPPLATILFLLLSAPTILLLRTFFES